jgi:hypothetical protein
VASALRIELHMPNTTILNAVAVAISRMAVCRFSGAIMRPRCAANEQAVDQRRGLYGAEHWSAISGFHGTPLSVII